MKYGKFHLGLAGLGTVGTGVYEALKEKKDLLLARTGVCVEVRKVAVADISKPRECQIDSALLTDNWRELVEDEGIDVIVELIGGVTVAKELVCAALKRKKPVVTGNKALLSQYGEELFALSKEEQTPIYFESAVAGGIPIIDSMRESLVANRFESIVGIINGTSNYILGRMSSEQLSYQKALEEAQVLGYAEADPSLDVNGGDAAHKALLLALLAYGTPLSYKDIYVEGIERVRPVDMDFAQKLGYAIKLLAVIRHHGGRGIELRVQPSFISQKHILSSVDGVFNAISVVGDIVGETLFYGRGAGRKPTASAVVSDIMLAGKNACVEGFYGGFTPYKEEVKLLPIEETETSFYVRFQVSDQTGIIAAIATILARHQIGISATMSQPGEKEGVQDLVFILHRCRFGHLQQALASISELEGMASLPTVFRIEEMKQ